LAFYRELGKKVVCAPSILSADFAELAAEVRKAQAGGAELVHFDTMDNHFVPNLTFGPVVAASLVRAIELPVDVHLMVENPENLIPAFIDAGVNSLTVHYEAVTHLHHVLEEIREGGCEAGVAINPTTPPEVLEWAVPYMDYVLVMTVNPGFGGQRFIPQMVDKVRRVREITGLPVEVDGGISPATAPAVVEAGAQVLVAGSAVFGGDPAEEIKKILSAARPASSFG